MHSDLIKRLYERRTELLEQHRAIEAELELLEEMAGAPAVREALEEYERDREAATRGSGRKTGKTPIWRMAVQILQEQGDPMTLEELANRILQEREFGGLNPLNSLAAHISQRKDQLVQRAGRVYLRERNQGTLGSSHEPSSGVSEQD